MVPLMKCNVTREGLVIDESQTVASGCLDTAIYKPTIVFIETKNSVTNKATELAECTLTKDARS